MTDVIDTSMTLAIGYSPWKVALLFGACAASVWFGWSVATEPWGGGNSIAVGVGWVVMAFSGLMSLVLLSRLLITKGAVLVFSPEGLLDQRVSSEVVAWKAIDSIDERSIQIKWPVPAQKWLVLKVKPDIETRLPLTPTIRMTHSANRMFGIDGLATHALGTKINHGKMMKIALAYWKAHGPGSAGQNLKNA
ncbi:STM3941 family protein [uncultured Hoeflea sp.]|uniref:STM3941 family protein n=1 Tax=uncultured Hoeflea sp. TaxID=538666 RepID=UPI0030EB228E|tara:strand:- start:3959 stop:4534 length:576 start_codon:yes stop_codon:yes gene_type:complete